MAALQSLDYATLPDIELVARARRGDRQAFRSIMQRCNQRLFRTARAVVRDDGEAEDVLQEAYMRAFAAIGDFRGEAAIATWLTRIVLNEAHGRLRKRRVTVPLEAIEAAQANAQILPFRGLLSESPEADMARNQIRRLLEQAVDDLPEPFRIVFILRDVEELSTEEVAAELSINTQTVKSRLHRARRRLREALDAQVADALVGIFPFLGARCERITETVLGRLG